MNLLLIFFHLIYWVLKWSIYFTVLVCAFDYYFIFVHELWILFISKILLFISIFPLTFIIIIYCNTDNYFFMINFSNSAFTIFTDFILFFDFFQIIQFTCIQSMTNLTLPHFFMYNWLHNIFNFLFNWYLFRYYILNIFNS